DDFKQSSELQFDYCYLETVQKLIADPAARESIKEMRAQRCNKLGELREYNDLTRQRAAEYFRDCKEALTDSEFGLLRDLAAYDVFQTVRIAAAEALYKKGLSADREKAQKIVFGLLTYPGFCMPHQDGADLVRERAARALVILNDYRPEVINALKLAVSDPFQNVKVAATEALKHLDQSLKNLDKVALPKSDFLSASAESRLAFLQRTIAENAAELGKAFKKERRDRALIRDLFYKISWRINELSWEYKYSLVKKKLVAEEEWHLFDFICSYLTVNPDVELENWVDVAAECGSLAKIMNGELKKGFDYPGLNKRLRPAFAYSQLTIIQQQITKFFELPFVADSNIDCHALLGLLMVVGEAAKRLEGLSVSLLEPVTDSFNITKDIRDLLEKKFPANLFTSAALIGNVCGSLAQLNEAINRLCKGQIAETVDINRAHFEQLLKLLEEESVFKYSEQAKLFFDGLRERPKQNLWLAYLRDVKRKDFLRGRFNIDDREFESVVGEVNKNKYLNLNKQQKQYLREIASRHLEGNKLLLSLLRLIGREKLSPDGISRFLKANKLDIPELEAAIPQGREDRAILLANLAERVGIEADNLLQLKEIFITLNKHRTQQDDFDRLLLDKIKRNPWLLNLTDKQIGFLEILNRDRAVSDQDDLDKILKENGVDPANIAKILQQENLGYSPKPYCNKFSYPKTADNEIIRIVRMIDKLINLLVAMKEKEPAIPFAELLRHNHHYQLALQLGVKAFGVIVKDQLGQQAKQQLLSSNSDELSAKHIRLLELFRNALAHRATEVDAHELAWFAEHWAIISYPRLRQIAAAPTDLPVTTSENQAEIVVTESMVAEHALL
ncbi:MAG: HEAT repeat domain-containing protein, partial [Gammaproteobacteria bacterium]|nr:HEAT repeat domain-containing protein [Gammaproteobacteria bacterium]